MTRNVGWAEPRPTVGSLAAQWLIKCSVYFGGCWLVLGIKLYGVIEACGVGLREAQLKRLLLVAQPTLLAASPSISPLWWMYSMYDLGSLFFI